MINDRLLAELGCDVAAHLPGIVLHELGHVIDHLFEHDELVGPQITDMPVEAEAEKMFEVMTSRETASFPAGTDMSQAGSE